MLVIDKDIHFQYQQRACRHNNVICWLFNSNIVCLPLLSPAVHLVYFPFAQLIVGRASSTLNLAHPSQFTSTQHWKADSQKHRRSVLKNRCLQKQPNRIGASTPILLFFQTRARAAALLPPSWHVRNTTARLDLDGAHVCLSQQNHKCKLLWRSSQECHNVFHLLLHGCLSGTLLHHGVILQRYFKQKSDSNKGFNFLLIIRHETFSLQLHISAYSTRVRWDNTHPRFVWPLKTFPLWFILILSLSAHSQLTLTVPTEAVTLAECVSSFTARRRLYIFFSFLQASCVVR